MLPGTIVLSCAASGAPKAIDLGFFCQNCTCFHVLSGQAVLPQCSSGLLRLTTAGRRPYFWLASRACTLKLTPGARGVTNALTLRGAPPHENKDHLVTLPHPVACMHVSITCTFTGLSTPSAKKAEHAGDAAAQHQRRSCTGKQQAASSAHTIGASQACTCRPMTPGICCSAGQDGQWGPLNRNGQAKIQLYDMHFEPRHAQNKGKQQVQAHSV